MAPQLHFFIGKGGVGKSTTSALCALQSTRLYSDTLLVSMDPAHNQQDIFERIFSEKPRNVTDYLAVKEVDTEYWMKKYLKDTQDQIKQTYSYHSAFNLQSSFNVLRFSPGLEEYALLLAFGDILHAETHRDAIIFDMPPTALTLRFFSLPSITLVWLEELLKLRKSIYAQKKIISKIRVAGRTLERDRVKTRLEHLIRVHEHIRGHFTSPKTHIHLVMNTDRLSRSESVRLKKRLNAIGLPIRRIIINKDSADAAGNAYKDAFASEPVIRFPLSSTALLGLDALEGYLKMFPHIALEALRTRSDAPWKPGFTTTPDVFPASRQARSENGRIVTAGTKPLSPPA